MISKAVIVALDASFVCMESFCSNRCWRKTVEIPSPDAPSFMLLFKLFWRILKGGSCEEGKSTVLFLVQELQATG